MITVDIGSKRFTQVQTNDDISFANAHHEYCISRVPGGDGTETEANDFGFIKFQEGPIKECGVNGCHNEDLLVIVLDRLQSFQSSDFSCRENALAITKLEEALHWLNARTSDREKRGVEGTNSK